MVLPKPKIVTSGDDPTKQWYVSFYVIDAEGKKRRRRKYVPRSITSRAEKWAYASRLAELIEAGLKSGAISGAPKAGTLSIFEATKKALELQSTYLRHRTMTSHQSAIKMLNDWLGKRSEMNVAAFSREWAASFMDDIRAQRKWKPKTHNLYLGYLKSIFDKIQDRGHIRTNPFDGIKNLPETDPDQRYWSAEHMDAFFTYTMAEMFWLYMVGQLIYKCGLRPAEILALKVENIDFDAGLLWVDGHGSKNRKRQAVTLPSQVQSNLQSYVQGAGKADYLITTDGIPGPVNCGRNYIHRYFKRVREKLALPPDLHIYGLKHTGAIEMDRMGLSPKEIQEQLRHHSLAQTDQYMRRVLVRANEKLKNW